MMAEAVNGARRWVVTVRSRERARGRRSSVEGDFRVDEMPRAVRDEREPAAHLSVEPAERLLELRDRVERSAS